MPGRRVVARRRVSGRFDSMSCGFGGLPGVGISSPITRSVNTGPNSILEVAHRDRATNIFIACEVIRRWCGFEVDRICVFGFYVFFIF